MNLERKTKPFPWRCPKCLQKKMNPALASYETEIKHDGRLHAIHIPNLRVPKCENCGEFVLDNEADEQITAALRKKLGLLSPEHIRSAREALGLTQKELARRLGIAPETISRWETGMLIQSRAMDNLMRLYFAFPKVRAVLTGDNQDPNLGLATVI